MKYIAKIKNKSRFKGSIRHKVPSKATPPTSAAATQPEKPASQKGPTSHDPQYYHSDNSENRLVVGENEEAQSPHMHYEDE
ncbi:MAG: hypothetical protein EBZ48_05850 [Proteobacteria bacterium]|nr:hypothetical protein [Pseudomonadota bacterium]